MFVNREHLLMTNVSECRSLVNGEHSNIHELLSSTPETGMRRRVNACKRGVQMQIRKSEQMHLLKSERTNVLTSVQMCLQIIRVLTIFFNLGFIPGRRGGWTDGAMDGQTLL